MSSKSYRNMALAGDQFSGASAELLEEQLVGLVKGQIHGMCFSPYLPGQKPGDTISEQQIRQRLAIVAPYTRWIRTFSFSDGNELIPAIAKEMGLKVLGGIWLGTDADKNARELEQGIAIANTGAIDILAVGNEVMLRQDLGEEELIEKIVEVKAQVSEVPVGYVDAYYEFELRPKIAQVCDIILANCYPFWEGCPQEYSLLYMKDMYRRAVDAAQGKPVVITETGWPSIGSRFHGAIPSRENAMKYFINTLQWVANDHIPLFWFSTFDELWKTGDEGDVGAYWGLWDQHGQPKYPFA